MNSGSRVMLRSARPATEVTSATKPAWRGRMSLRAARTAAVGVAMAPSTVLIVRSPSSRHR
jgi:hypothetical protein